MNFIFHYYLSSLSFKLPSSFWWKKEGCNVISVEIIIREMKGGRGEKEKKRKKRKRDLYRHRERKRVWSDRRKIRTIPLNSLQNIIILSLVDSFFIAHFSSGQTIVSFFFSFFLRAISFYEIGKKIVKSCTNNYFPLKFFSLFYRRYFIEE